MLDSSWSKVKGSRTGGTYLDGQIFVNSHRFAEDIDILHEIGQFPCVPKLVKGALFWCRLGGFHLITISLAGAHINDALGVSLNYRIVCRGGQSL